MKVSVIIPTLNGAGNIENVLKAISKDEVDELLVVDGGSTDDTIEIVKRLGYPLIIQDNPGLGRAANYVLGIHTGMLKSC